MIDVLTGFFDELRDAGLPVSLSEAIDAAEAVRAVPLDAKMFLRSALETTLVKTPDHYALFSTVFDIYFADRRLQRIGDLPEAPDEALPEPAEMDPDLAMAAAHGELPQMTPAMLHELATEALYTGERVMMNDVALFAVAMYGAISGSKSSSVSYYLHRVLRGLDLDKIVDWLMASHSLVTESGHPGAAPEQFPGSLGNLGTRLMFDEYKARAALLRRFVEEEILRQLIEEHGSAAVGASLKGTMLDEVDIIHASQEELLLMRRTLEPLSRRLAARLTRTRRNPRSGRLDFRTTIRRSLSSGGVPINPRFKAKHPSRPEVFLLADVSGSVAAFARFIFHLVYAMAMSFADIRIVVFIDGVDEVTDVLQHCSTITEAIDRLAIAVNAIHQGGVSNYGNAFRVFYDRFGDVVGKRTNVIILGDARSNHSAPEIEVLSKIQQQVRRVFWLNPEPREHWGTGDSIMEEYALHIDGLYECRNLGQLKRFVNTLA